ncbi:ornithine cyclodeaminase [Salinibacterium sp. G-O1]|uniref:ornithine cyclodeaminase n=1 Tax=Salinibacterium sp. G-O1 TaxID=3046208 RepID=UPI0024B8F53C|nr:ornithine cyclodeaminase [Salinibacterium sp. G-O1]MDJ0334460.1 ornithine cyclodeaminase [Salinibacterium sp. G-O1]
MVRFVDVGNMSRWIASTGVESIITGMVAYLEEDFARWPIFDKSPRVASHSPLGVIELMPTSDGETYAFKYVNGHPSNPSRGHQTVTAFGVLADVNTGYPTFWSEMTLLTALRTAATSVFAAKLLARPESTVMAMIGTGTQAEFQALGFRAGLGITTLRVWDTDPAALDKFIENVSPLGFEIDRATDARDAVRGADIVTTCTADKTNATIISNDMVEPGMHLNAIGGDCPGKTELDAAILRRSDVFVEFPEQTRIEGEIQQVEADFPVTELWRVLVGEAEGRTSAEQVTVFDSVGFAIEDFSALRYARDAVDGTDFFTDVDLIAEPADPKNLYSLVAAAAVVSA